MPPLKTYSYGEDVIINGQNVGKALFDTRTGKPLTPPEQVPTTIGGYGVNATRTGQSSTAQPIGNLMGGSQQTSTQTQTKVTDPNIPIGSAFNMPSLSTVSDQENALAELYRKQAAGEDIVDESQIRSQTLSEFQDRINAINRIYDQQLERARQQGVGRIGQGTAVMAARGLAGSGRGQAIQESVLDQNRQIEETIQAEREASLTEVYGVANTAAKEAAKAKREAILGGAKSYIEFLKGSEERKKENLNTTVAALLTQGIDPETMSPDELNKITSQIGASTGDLITSYKQGKLKKDVEQTELERKRAKEDADLAKVQTETELAKAKFEEDKRKFGLEYALKQQELDIKRGEFDLKKGEATKATGVSTMTPDQIAFLNTSLNKAEELKGAAGRGAIARGIGSAISGDNDFNRLSKNLDSIKTNVLTLMADPNVKKFFGPQMSNADVQLMASIGTSLDPVSNSPQDIQDEITRIRDIVNRATTAVQEGTGVNQSTQGGTYQSTTTGRTYSLPNQ